MDTEITNVTVYKAQFDGYADFFITCKVKTSRFRGIITTDTHYAETFSDAKMYLNSDILNCVLPEYANYADRSEIYEIIDKAVSEAKIKAVNLDRFYDIYNK